jgi:FeoC like transcriptional regulator
VLWGKESASFDDLCAKMQRKPEFAERVMAQMVRKGMIEQHGASYGLMPVVRQDIEDIFHSDQMLLDSMWGEPRTK